jgi:ribonuclease HII
MELICGVDEAGRGPLAGPVTAAAVILPERFPMECLNDSKRLSEREREESARIIRKQATAFSVGWAWPEEIDRYNIHFAALLAMSRALLSLSVKPDLVLVDGKFIPASNLDCRAVVRGDTFVPAIQAASIIAKTQRDLWMRRYARIEPAYLFEKHKGYPTKEHRQRLRCFGGCPIHRKSFKPVLFLQNQRLYENHPENSQDLHETQ